MENEQKGAFFICYSPLGLYDSGLSNKDQICNSVVPLCVNLLDWMNAKPKLCFGVDFPQVFAGQLELFQAFNISLEKLKFDISAFSKTKVIMGKPMPWFSPLDP